MAAAATLTYHWLWAESHWIGCPISPEFLSDTLLTTLKTPPLLLILIASPSNASLKVFATLTCVSVDKPEDALALVIA